MKLDPRLLLSPSSAGRESLSPLFKGNFPDGKFPALDPKLMHDDPLALRSGGIKVRRFPRRPVPKKFAKKWMDDVKLLDLKMVASFGCGCPEGAASIQAWGAVPYYNDGVDGDLRCGCNAFIYPFAEWNTCLQFDFFIGATLIAQGSFMHENDWGPFNDTHYGDNYKAFGWKQYIWMDGEGYLHSCDSIAWYNFCEGTTDVISLDPSESFNYVGTNDAVVCKGSATAPGDLAVDSGTAGYLIYF